MKKAFIISLRLSCIVLFAFSMYNLLNIVFEYAKGKSIYYDTVQDCIEENPDFSVSESSDAINGSASVPIIVDFEDLQRQNKDVVGWIYSENTPINYPILQGDDNEKYLHQMINGEENSAGSIFMDCRCANDFSAPNTIIYGHHMKNNSMFGTIHNYVDQNYYEAHPNIWIITPTQNYLAEIFAGCVVDDDAAIYNSYLSIEELNCTISDILSKSSFTALDSEYMDSNLHIVTLSTCSYEYKNARYVLLGRLKEIDVITAS